MDNVNNDNTRKRGEAKNFSARFAKKHLHVGGNSLFEDLSTDGEGVMKYLHDLHQHVPVLPLVTPNRDEATPPLPSQSDILDKTSFPLGKISVIEVDPLKDPPLEWYCVNYSNKKLTTLSPYKITEICFKETAKYIAVVFNLVWGYPCVMGGGVINHYHSTSIVAEIVRPVISILMEKKNFTRWMMGRSTPDDCVFNKVQLRY